MAGAGGIVWLASYPKSGNTWLRLLLANLLGAGDRPADINRMGLDSRPLAARHEVEDLAPIDTTLLTPDEVDLLRPRVLEAVVAAETGRLFVKCHDAYRCNVAGEPVLGRGTGAAAVYVVRDPRDVAVSLAHHNGRSIDVTIAHMADERCTTSANGSRPTRQVPQLLSTWSGHVESWASQRDVPVHVLRYEDLLADPTGRFGAVAAFLGLAATGEAIARAVRFADFSELQRQERRDGFSERLSWSTAPFFRSGRAGAWADVLTPAQAATIVADHGPVMERFGYV